MQGKQQLCIHMLYELLVGQREYPAQPKGSFWFHVIDARGDILLVMLLYKFALVLLQSHLGI